MAMNYFVEGMMCLLVGKNSCGKYAYTYIFVYTCISLHSPGFLKNFVKSVFYLAQDPLHAGMSEFSVPK